MSAESLKRIYLKDYQPTPYQLAFVDLDFLLDNENTRIVSRLEFLPKSDHPIKNAPLILDGKNLILESVTLNGKVLDRNDYKLTDDQLIIAHVPQEPFILELSNFCNPQANSALSGLYKSRDLFCTQCEAEGFRHITYSYDRPDVMALYRVRIEAQKHDYPVLLSNGDLEDSGDVAGTDRHFALWSDPHPKPSYLFALVAGKLGKISDYFITKTGRNIALNIYVEPGKEPRTQWAMECLKAAMAWDEKIFGREYDLDIFNIVAVSDFNAGAMENKGLNIFNDRYILASGALATDADHIAVESIIAHEYFHNWTGNRITCRDWFQLCLKEGLTVFRDQEFSSDHRSRALKRIEDVRNLRERQFVEDAGPLAHPVRPASFVEISNFYTATVYEKGAELVRMIKLLIGADNFDKAMTLYFERYDGQAVTMEDFIACMAETSGRNLQQFFNWYEQAGTPHIIVHDTYDERQKIYQLTLTQTISGSPKEEDKHPLHIPLMIGLIGPDGKDMPLDLQDTGLLDEPLIELTKSEQCFTFQNISHRPVLSLNRNFSAPIQLKSPMSDEALLIMLTSDKDSFNRWEAGQILSKSLIMKMMASLSQGTSLKEIKAYTDALAIILNDTQLDDAFKAEMLLLPSELACATMLGGDADPDLIHKAHRLVSTGIATELYPILQKLWEQTAQTGPYKPDHLACARRSLRFRILQMFAAAAPEEAKAYALAELENPVNMTAEIGAISALVYLGGAECAQSLQKFHQRYRHNSILLCKWFSLNAAVAAPQTVDNIVQLTQHEDFSYHIPNLVHALLGGFMRNQVSFNRIDGQGYRLVAEMLLKIDHLNPQTAARLVGGFDKTKLFEKMRQKQAHMALESMLKTPELSVNSREIITKLLEK